MRNNIEALLLKLYLFTTHLRNNKVTSKKQLLERGFLKTIFFKQYNIKY